MFSLKMSHSSSRPDIHPQHFPTQDEREGDCLLVVKNWRGGRLLVWWLQKLQRCTFTFNLLLDPNSQMCHELWARRNSLKNQNPAFKFCRYQLRHSIQISNCKAVTLRRLSPRQIQRCGTTWYRGILVELVLCVLLGHPKSKIANWMKLVTFAFFSSQYHVSELN